MTTLPAVISNQLMVLSDESFEQQSLHWQAKQMSKRARAAIDKVEGAQAKTRLVTHFMAWACKPTVMEFQAVMNELRKLKGEEELETYNPEDPERMFDDLNKPKPPKEKKRAPRFIEAELKRIFRKISLKCHEDRTTDSNLREFFPLAKECYDEHDLEMLQMLWDGVQDYLKLKKNSKKFAEYLAMRVRQLKEQEEKATTDLVQWEESLYGKMVNAYSCGDHKLAAQTYTEILEGQMADARLHITVLRARHRANEPRSYKIGNPDDFKHLFKNL